MNSREASVKSANGRNELHDWTGGEETMKMRTLGFSAMVITACGGATVATAVQGDTASSGGSSMANLPAGVPAWYGAFGNGVTITLSGSYVVISTKGVPDHKS